ncbi:MAG: hypothetical protein HDS82_06030 [Bacteroidales bacterium]|nr:hypothetical protein [Bacteroidales bacterium]
MATVINNGVSMVNGMLVSWAGIVVTDKIRNCHISANARKWKEGDKGQEVELPLDTSHIEWG